MPITPLHLAAALPIKQAAKDKFSLWAFIAVNVIIDLEPITVHLLELEKHGLAMHGGIHTMIGALIVAGVVSLFRWRLSWLLGALYGGVSHVLMDATVHSEMKPFVPLIADNPLYMGWMEPLSLLCLIVVAWYGIPSLFLTVRNAMNSLRNLTERPDKRAWDAPQPPLGRTQMSKIIALASWILLYVPVLLLAAIGVVFAEIRFDYGVLHEGFAPSRLSSGYAYILGLCLLPSILWMAVTNVVR